MAFNFSPRIVTDGLVLHLDAANPKSYVSGSTTWRDLSRSENNGTLVNGPTFDSGNGGNIVFDGTNDVVDCGNPSSLSLGSEGTLSAWVKTSRTYPSNTTSLYFRGIMGKVISGAAGRQSYLLDWYGDNASTRVLRISVGDSVAATAATLNNFDFENAWKHVMGTWNGSVVQLYVNGILRSSAPNSRVAQTISNSFVVGRVFSSAFWEGNISQTNVYNRYFTATEILQNYNATKGRYGL